MSGLAKTRVNAVIIRRDSITTSNHSQIVAFYDKFSRVTLACRQLGSDNWTVQATKYIGNTCDTHNAISIMVDGDRLEAEQEQSGISVLENRCA